MDRLSRSDWAILALSICSVLVMALPDYDLASWATADTSSIDDGTSAFSVTVLGPDGTAGPMADADISDPAVLSKVAESFIEGKTIVSNTQYPFVSNPDVFGSVAFSGDGDLYAIKRIVDENRTICYGISGCTPDEASSELASLLSEGDIGLPSYAENAYNNIEVVHHYKLDSRGWFNADILYSQIVHNSGGYDKWVMRYDLESVPMDGYQTKTVKVYDEYSAATNLGSRLIEHGPHTTAGTYSTTAQVALIFPFSASTGIGWSYSIPDVVVHNNCNTALGLFSITHEIKEDTASSMDTFNCVPGALIECEDGDVDTAYYCSDHLTDVLQRYVNGHWRSYTYGYTVNPILYLDR